ncbi:metallophosphoesterase [Halobacillus amylolyticus]|uniref:Metallophosphoesterase n=1 Tax=Halobacillus amylolyticus TaxID=2932259 RepID=A0ABY4HDW9_9BACI|nr:metallophosphoesterase [Halobacillus amylolyticus]UOR12996.1 metallophosphoesterase [Halobacillus amylolyticus]
MILTRRGFIKKFLLSGLGLVGISGGGYYYARYIEPHMLQRQEYTLSNDKIPHSFDGSKVVQFSDTHIGFNYNLEQFTQLIQTINQEEPDLIVFTGDLVDAPHTYRFDQSIPQLLKKLKAPLGKYWIYGNHDHGGYGTETVKAVMEAGGFKLLQNSVALIDNGQDNFALAGLDDVMLGSPDITATAKQIKGEPFTILLVHEPDVADQMKNHGIHVQLSGHSHGGQIQLPFIGAIVTPPYAETYIEGKHTISEQLTLYVSKGIGTTRLPYRFMCRPEYSVFHLNTKD